MSPIPQPATIRPLGPIQDAWPKIGPIHKSYMGILGAVGTVMGFASSIALIVAHGGKLPKWPFTGDRWNPKPSSEKDKDEKKDDVTEEDILEDELAQLGGALAKRSFIDIDEDLLHDFMAEILHRDSLSSL
jgi:hypothetical protein